MPRLPKAPRIRHRQVPEISIDEIRDFVRDRQRRIALGWRNDPRLAAWQTVTAPLWLGSGIPVPDRPVWSANAAAPLANDGLTTTEQGRWLASQMDALTRRFWLAWMTAATLRGVALGTIACTIWTLGAIAGLFPQPRVLPFVLLVAFGGLIGLAFGLVNRPSLPRVAAMLDRTFDLRERMVTAFSPPDATPRIRAIQLADAANAFMEIRHDVRGAAVLPMREMVIAALAGIALVTALLFNIASTGIAPTQPVAIPVFVPSSERFARQAQEQKAQALADAAKQEPVAAAPDSQSGSADTGTVGDLRAVGTALGTNETTSPAATQIAEGDYAGAKDSLHQSADSAANLPQEQRDALADQLDQAAKGMADGPLKDATEKAADGMRAGGDAAKQGMNDLADQIGKTGQQATTQGQASSTGSTKEGASGASQQSQSSASSSSANGSGQQGQSGDKAQSGQSGSSDSGSSQGNPGEGVAASSGIGSDPSQEGSGQQGSQGASGGSSQSGAGQAGQQGQSGASSSGASGSGGASQPSGSGGQTGSNDQSGAGGSQASGADGGSQANGAAGGSAGSNEAKAGGSDSAKDGSPNTAQDGAASSNTKPGDPGTTAGNSDVPSASSGNETVVLQGTSEESGVATGNETGASSSGSGSGAGAAAGSGKQGTVGPAGPDSNRVPEKYRDLVKAYFDGDGLPTEDDGQ